MKTILAAVDFSSGSKRVVTQAAELARALGGRVVILHVLPLQPFKPDLGLLGDPPAGWKRAVEKNALERLASLQAECRKASVTSATVCVTGFPTTLVLAQAKKARADFIVMGSHGHTAFFDLIVGSTASGVLKRAVCPVILVPSPKRTQRTARS